MKKYIFLFVLLVFVSFSQVTDAAILYSESIPLSPGWNIVSTPKILESHSFSLPGTSDNFDIYTLDASSTTGWSTLADLGQSEFTPLFGYFVNNKSGTKQILTFNYKASTTPNERFFERSFSKSGWYSFGISNPTYAKKTIDTTTLDTDNQSKILISANGGYDSVVDLTNDQGRKSVAVGDNWKQAVAGDVNNLNDFIETKGYVMHVIQSNSLYSGFQNNDVPVVQLVAPSAQVSISTDPSSVQANLVPVTDTANGQYLGFPVLTFAVNAQNDDVHIRNLKVDINAVGTGSTSVAYLYQGSTLVQSVAVINGSAVFGNITNGTAGARITSNTSLPYTVKVDVKGVLTGTLVVTASVDTGTSTVVLDSQDEVVENIGGSAVGFPQTVAGKGPAFALASAPTLAKIVSNSDTSGNATTTYTATFLVNVSAVGTDLTFGLTGTTTPSFSTTTSAAVVYANGVATNNSGYSLAVNYSQPTGTTPVSGGFVLSRGQSVQIPVTYAFSVRNPGTNTYALQLTGIATDVLTTSFMQYLTAWRTNVQ